MILDGTSREIPEWVDTELTRLAGISYQDIDMALATYGNTPGCHQPLLYSISRLVSEKKVSSTLEYGSGATTLLFAALQRKYETKALSIENFAEWANVTNMALDFLQLPPILSQQDLVCKLLGHRDLVLFDCMPVEARYGLPSLLLERHIISPDTILMWDDIQNEELFEKIKELKLGQVKLFQSENRGIAVIDPANKIDFIKWRWE